MREVLDPFKKSPKETPLEGEIIFSNPGGSEPKKIFDPWDKLRGAFRGRDLSKTEIKAETKTGVTVETGSEPSSKKEDEKDPLIEIFKKYNIGKEVSREEQESVFLGQLRRELAEGDFDVWKSVKDKKITDLDGSKDFDLEDMDKLVNQERLGGINKVAEYYVSILGEKAEIQEDETIEEWTRRIVKISFEAGK